MRFSFKTYMNKKKEERASIHDQNVDILYPELIRYTNWSNTIRRIFEFSSKICIGSIFIGFLVVLLDGGKIVHDWAKICHKICIIIFCISLVVFLISFFSNYCFSFVWKCPVCKGKLPWYTRVIVKFTPNKRQLVNKNIKTICEESNIKCLDFEDLLIPSKCPYCGEKLWVSKER